MAVTLGSGDLGPVPPYGTVAWHAYMAKTGGYQPESDLRLVQQWINEGNQEAIDAAKKYGLNVTFPGGGDDTGPGGGGGGGDTTTPPETPAPPIFGPPQGTTPDTIFPTPGAALPSSVPRPFGMPEGGLTPYPQLGGTFANRMWQQPQAAIQSALMSRIGPALFGNPQPVPGSGTPGQQPQMPQFNVNPFAQMLMQGGRRLAPSMLSGNVLPRLPWQTGG